MQQHAKIVYCDLYYRPRILTCFMLVVQSCTLSAWMWKLFCVRGLKYQQQWPFTITSSISNGFITLYVSSGVMLSSIDRSTKIPKGLTGYRYIYILEVYMAVKPFCFSSDEYCFDVSHFRISEYFETPWPHYLILFVVHLWNYTRIMHIYLSIAASVILTGI